MAKCWDVKLSILMCDLWNIDDGILDNKIMQLLFKEYDVYAIFTLQLLYVHHDG